MARAVLIVEDEPDQNEMLAQLVKRRGFSVVQTYLGKEGVNRARESPPDLLLLDLMLPDIDGFEVCESLRRSRDTNLIPIVMATQLTDAARRLQGFRVGANAYVVKPYSREQIYDAIDIALATPRRGIAGAMLPAPGRGASPSALALTLALAVSLRPGEKTKCSSP